MAFPFIAGLALGAVAVAAFNNKDELKEAANKGFEKTKEVADDIKKTASSTVDCVKEKMAKDEPKPKTTRKTPTKRATKTTTKTTKKTTPKTVKEADDK